MAVSQDFDAVIVGAGAIGAACALKLAHSQPKAKIAIVERGTMLDAELGENLRVWALGEVATQLLSDVGVFQQLDAEACFPYSRMVVWDENSEGELKFAAQEFDRDALGHMVDASFCTQILQQQLSGMSNITSFFSTQVDALDQHKGSRSLVLDGDVVTTKLVIAADGAQSSIRRMAKIFAPTKSYEQRGIVAKIRSEQAHKDTAWQRFLETGPLAVLPLADNYSSIVWSTSELEASELLICDQTQFESRLQSALENRLGKIELMSERFAFPLTSRQAETYYRPGLVLIGDAAHSIHPLAGQGANLGFKDVAALVEILSHSKDWRDPAALTKYQRQRRPDNLQTDFLMTSLHLAYSNNSPWWSLARGRGMNWLTQNARIKDWLARQGMGL